MITNDSAEITQIVSTASSTRRTTKVSIETPSTVPASPARSAREGSHRSRLVVERLGVRAAGRAAMLCDTSPARDIAELSVYEAHPHQRRRLAHGADRVLLIDQDFPYLLRRLVALVVLLAGSGPEQLVDPLPVRIGRLPPQPSV